MLSKFGFAYKDDFFDSLLYFCEISSISSLLNITFSFFSLDGVVRFVFWIPGLLFLLLKFAFSAANFKANEGGSPLDFILLSEGFMRF